MIEVREVLRRFGAGQAVRRIARETGVGRNTVDRYVAAARARGYEAGEPTDELVAQVAQDVQARPVPEPSEQRLALAARREQIETWLKADGSKFTKVHMLLERQGTEVSYATLRRFVIDEFGWGMRTPSVRVDDPAPGQEAQIDFGCMGLMFDPEKGRSRKLWALSATSGSMTLKIRWLHEGAQRQAATRWSRRVGVFDRGGNPLYRASTEPRLDGRGEQEIAQRAVEWQERLQRSRDSMVAERELPRCPQLSRRSLQPSRDSASSTWTVPAFTRTTASHLGKLGSPNSSTLYSSPSTSGWSGRKAT